MNHQSGQSEIEGSELEIKERNWDCCKSETRVQGVKSGIAGFGIFGWGS